MLNPASELPTDDAFHHVHAYITVVQAWHICIMGAACFFELLMALIWPVALATVGLASVGCLAWLTARTTAYTLTDRRVVMRIGIVLTLTFNLPLQRIASAALSPHGRTGDIALSLVANERIGYFHLWPHARAWELRRPQPTLRCITDAAAVGALIQRQWMAVHPQSQVVQTEANPGTPSSPSPAGTPLGEPRHQPEAVTA